MKISSDPKVFTSRLPVQPERTHLRADLPPPLTSCSISGIKSTQGFCPNCQGDSQLCTYSKRRHRSTFQGCDDKHSIASGNAIGSHLADVEEEAAWSCQSHYISNERFSCASNRTRSKSQAPLSRNQCARLGSLQSEILSTLFCKLKQGVSTDSVIEAASVPQRWSTACAHWVRPQAQGASKFIRPLRFHKKRGRKMSIRGSSQRILIAVAWAQSHQPSRLRRRCDSASRRSHPDLRLLDDRTLGRFAPNPMGRRLFGAALTSGLGNKVFFLADNAGMKCCQGTMVCCTGIMQISKRFFAAAWIAAGKDCGASVNWPLRVISRSPAAMSVASTIFRESISVKSRCNTPYQIHGATGAQMTTVWQKKRVRNCQAI